MAGLKGLSEKFVIENESFLLISSKHFVKLQKVPKVISEIQNNMKRRRFVDSRK